MKQSTTEHLPVIWNGKKYYSIIKFDCHDVFLKITKEGGSYSTSIPISELEHRKKWNTKASVKIKELEDYVVFSIVDDWGTTEIMQIPKTMQEEIKTARYSAEKEELFLQ